MADDLKSRAGFLAQFTVLKGAVRELWLIFGAKLLGILAYGVMNATLVLWLSYDLGYSDERAGYLVGTWSTVMTLVTVLVGSLVDAIGLRKALLLGSALCLFARGMMTFTTAKWLVLPFGLFVLAVGEAFMTPVMVAAVRRYSTTAQRSISFSIFYAMMNAGFGIAYWIFDFVRQTLGERGHFQVPGLGLELTTYQTLFLVSLLLTLPNLLLTYFFLRPGVEATDEGVKITPERPKRVGVGLGKAFALMIRDTVMETRRIFVGLWRQPAFYKFLVFLSLCVAVRLIFVHMYYTYPKFGIRELGEGAPIGRLWSINSILIVVLVPIVGALTQKIPAYRMVVVGSSVSALSVFLMAMPPAWFQAMADGLPGRLIAHDWLGVQGEPHPYYVMIFLYVVVLSLGEALWSPRLYEYTAAIAPKGQEASYMSMSYLPFFVAKFTASMFSGLLLARYCPETGPRDSQTLWLIIALTTMITPVGLLALRRFIRVQEAGREE
ncbi:MAG: MFS transporter [Verrucomicrobia bacterium]|nr:MFS transporter [Verrucomicrobiota bacterium]